MICNCDEISILTRQDIFLKILGKLFTELDYNIDIVIPLILKYVDVDTLHAMLLVCKKWNKIFKNCICWKYYLTRMVEDSCQWRSISIDFKWYF